MLSLYITVINKGLKSGLISGRATHHPPGRQKLNELMFVWCTHTAHGGSVGARLAAERAMLHAYGPLQQMPHVDR